MPNGDPRDGFFYPTLTLMMDSYILQFNRQKVNKPQINPTCLLCKRTRVTLEHYILDCPALNTFGKVRQKFENRIMARVYVWSIMRSTMYQKAPFW